jgi:hypothetical protein
MGKKTKVKAVMAIEKAQNQEKKLKIQLRPSKKAQNKEKRLKISS